MKKFSFSLERMLGFKRTLYEKERNELARLRAERNALQKKRDGTEQQMLVMDSEFRRKAATEGVGYQEINQVKFHRENSNRLIRQYEIEIEAKEEEIAEQLKIVIQLDRDVKSLEKLREKQWDEYIYAANKEEQERILEMVSGKHLEKQMEAEAEEKRAAEIAALAQ